MVPENPRMLIGVTGVWWPEDREGVWDGELKSSMSMTRVWGSGLGIPMCSDGSAVEGGAGGGLWGAVGRWVLPPQKTSDPPMGRNVYYRPRNIRRDDDLLRPGSGGCNV